MSNYYILRSGAVDFVEERKTAISVRCIYSLFETENYSALITAETYKVAKELFLECERLAVEYNRDDLTIKRDGNFSRIQFGKNKITAMSCKFDGSRIKDLRAKEIVVTDILLKDRKIIQNIVFGIYSGGDSGA